MRRICLTLLVCALVAPATAVAGGSTPTTAATSGSLGISGAPGAPGASGSISLVGKGVVFGYVAHGTVIVYSYKADGNAVPTVSGAKMTLSSDASSVVYTGNGMRFLFPGGPYQLEIDGVGIDLSAVGNGSVSALGSGTLNADNVMLALGRIPTGASWGPLG